MPAMKTRPPIDAMLKVEKSLRDAGSSVKIREILASAASSGEIDEYWFDFILLIAAFWLRKCGEKQDSIALIKEKCAWHGWAYEGFR
jgi:hypothetical protein